MDGMAQVGSFDQATNEAMITNMKRIVDEWAALGQNKASAQASLQDQLNAQHLRFVDDQHTLVMRSADLGAALANRVAQNHATLDNLVWAGEVDTTAQGAMATNLSNQMRSVAFEAVQSAMAQAAVTSPPAQGTTGVANGALQTQVAPELAQILVNANTVQTALLAELAQIEKALAVLLVRVTGDAAVG
jgi:hypothetical protein